jgi:hypothetical protein
MPLAAEIDIASMPQQKQLQYRTEVIEKDC